MAKRPIPPVEIPPSLSKQQGKQALTVMKEKGEKLLAVRPISKEEFSTWRQSSYKFIEKTFGSESGHLFTFAGEGRIHVVGYGSGPSEAYLENERAKDLTREIAVLASLVDQLDTEIALEAPKVSTSNSLDVEIWALMHAKVTTSAKARFDSGQYADAVEAAFKELNTVIKEMVKKKTGNELDGAALMQKAFSPNAPVLVALDDLSTESGKNIQQGYMQIFAGAMVGIRNPKAHANLSITKERCLHLLFLASLLFHKIDERP